MAQYGHDTGGWNSLIDLRSRKLLFLLTVSDDVAEGLVVQGAWDIDGGELHKGINLLLVEAGGLAGKGIEQDLVGDFALARGIEDLER